ncbi:MAG TPA: glutaredoxin family protein [Deltaproteobacteria bacterium]|jgi:glutaredoxin|nr:glutaredoxin family protein [Deltaproteobacteria bacterium]OQC28711.1 MAG: glutaredoxin 3 [Deltaproteobacteria bacterium ADurb.Bin072]HRW79927.1 glutaredoxin family protein [Desulfomonilia bacterium]HNQ86227.1 glutaredoxin family protein [Deltaproteobacteria bacterium]HNS90463.1 glutaredoxin family protein [Deltaproteobacteria bacterium]
MNNAVKVFTLSTCSHCKAAKKFLNDHDVTFDFTDVDLLEGEEKALVIEEVKKYNPRLTFPTIIINGDRVIIGFQDREIKEALDL